MTKRTEPSSASASTLMRQSRSAASAYVGKITASTVQTSTARLISNSPFVTLLLPYHSPRGMSVPGPEAMGTAAKVWHRCRCAKTDGGAPMTDDLSRSLIAFEQNSTMVVVLEMSQSS